MKRLILLIDDDKLPMPFYVKALERKGFNVKHCFEPDSAWDFLTKKEEIDAVILDIMMPYGNKYNPETTNQGLKTGVLLAKDISEKYPDIPIVVLTNVKNRITLNEIRTVASVKKVLQKTDCPPFEVAEIIQNITGNRRENSENEGCQR